MRSGGRGPAAARNAGWRTTTAEWVAFLDDDVLLPADWSCRLAADLAATDDDGANPRRREPGPHPRPAAGSPAPDRLGAQHRRPHHGAVGDRRHGLPAGGARRGARLRRALPARLPRGRRPRAPRTARGVAARPRPADHRPELLGLVLMADAPGRLPRACATSPSSWAVACRGCGPCPWVEAWRSGDDAVPHAVGVLRRDLATLLPDREA
ncbi:glycosyltransferase family 2 protein [Georgenia sp. SUBG003]|uniref:glycosyltransferase family 2 protein n=1 Tax=Georgenia sp. SUBG003 TaxID=1497974 RepID=UPI003AB21BB9